MLHADRLEVSKEENKQKFDPSHSKLALPPPISRKDVYLPLFGHHQDSLYKESFEYLGPNTFE